MDIGIINGLRDEIQTLYNESLAKNHGYEDRTDTFMYRSQIDILNKVIDEIRESANLTSIPDTYAEMEYEDFNSPEAIAGARFDDLNLMRYMER